MINKNHKNQGFTLIETFVAITILLIAVLGPLTVLSRSIVTSTFVKNEVTAYYLAQSAIEDVVSYQKSTNVAESGTESWLLGIPADCVNTSSTEEPVGKGCTVNTNANNEEDINFDVSIGTCLGIEKKNCTFVKRDPDGVYSSLANIEGNSDYSEAIPTSRFLRQIYITPNIDQTSAKVEVLIIWSNGTLGLRHFTLSTYIFNYLTN